MSTASGAGPGAPRPDDRSRAAAEAVFALLRRWRDWMRRDGMRNVTLSFRQFDQIVEALAYLLTDGAPMHITLSPVAADDAPVACAHHPSRPATHVITVVYDAPAGHIEHWPQCTDCVLRLTRPVLDAQTTMGTGAGSRQEDTP